jgi:hypothetical protein
MSPFGVTTSSSGAYTITVNYGWSGTVTPTLAGYTFSPVSQTYSNVASNQVTNYTGTPITFTISGNISFSGSPIIGAVMSGLPGSPATNSSGNYTGTVSYGWSGTVTPTLSYCSFTPVSTTYSNVTSNITTNYTARMGKHAGNQIIELPQEFALRQNVPNPFNPTSIISYQLPGENTRYNVSLKVYDILGREAATLVDGMKGAGYYSATFDGSHLASGIYFARIIASPEDSNKPFTKIVKMLLMK